MPLWLGSRNLLLAFPIISFNYIKSKSSPISTVLIIPQNLFRRNITGSVRGRLGLLEHGEGWTEKRRRVHKRTEAEDKTGPQSNLQQDTLVLHTGHVVNFDSNLVICIFSSVKFYKNPSL